MRIFPVGFLETEIRKGSTIMYHSVTFGSKNSFTDWHLVPDSRPVITMPEVKTTYVDIPGASGALDLSESLTKYPLYNNRTGELKFHVLNGYANWKDRYHEIANYLHGKRIKITLEDDPDYYYEGRVKIAWTSNNNGTWSDISFSYELDPYKYAQQEVSYVKLIGASTYSLDFSDESVGRMPIVPYFIVNSLETSGASVRLTNPELEITNRVKQISSNGTHTFYDLILSNISGNNHCLLTVAGSGYVEIRYRKGDL